MTVVIEQDTKFRREVLEDWVDKSPSPPAIPEVSVDFAAQVQMAQLSARARIDRENGRPRPKGKLYSRQGLNALYDSGQLVKGDLTGQTSFLHRDESGEREVEMKPVVIDIGTRGKPDKYTLRIPTKPEERTIFLPKAKSGRQM